MNPLVQVCEKKIVLSILLQLLIEFNRSFVGGLEGRMQGISQRAILPLMPLNRLNLTLVFGGL